LLHPPPRGGCLPLSANIKIGTGATAEDICVIILVTPISNANVVVTFVKEAGGETHPKCTPPFPLSALGLGIFL